MASPQSPDASEIRRRGRQRLIGAVAIALLMVVFVPMVLDSEPRGARQEPKLDIPPRESAPPLPAPRPERVAEPKAAVPAEAPQSAASAEAAKSEASKAGAAPASSSPVQPTVSTATTAKVAVVEPKAAAPAAPKAATTAAPKVGFAVQVGAFREDVKLQQARETLTASKIQSYTEPSGDLTRLRVGPFPTREAAEKTAAVIRRSVPDAKVVPLP